MLLIYKTKLESIKSDLLSIGLKVIVSNELALKAIETKKYNLFNDAKDELVYLEKIANKIDNMIVNILALYSPEAKDLRVLIAYLKITNEIIRASANTKSFIKSFSKIVTFDIDLDKINEYGTPLHKSTILAIKTAMEIITLEQEDETEDYFHKVIIEESKTDDLYSMIEKNILKMISKNKELSKDYFEVLSSLRRLEKIADRAVSIANLLLYAYLGGKLNQA